MKFMEALQHLLEGKYVQRPVWKQTGEYLVSLPGFAALMKARVQPSPGFAQWGPLTEDLLADDYEVQAPV